MNVEKEPRVKLIKFSKTFEDSPNKKVPLVFNAVFLVFLQVAAHVGSDFNEIEDGTKGQTTTAMRVSSREIQRNRRNEK